MLTGLLWKSCNLNSTWFITAFGLHLNYYLWPCLPINLKLVSLFITEVYISSRIYRQLTDYKWETAMQVTDIDSWTSLSIWALEQIRFAKCISVAKNAYKEQTQYSQRCEMRARLLSSVVWPHNTYPSTVCRCPGEQRTMFCVIKLCVMHSFLVFSENKVSSLLPSFFLVVCLNVRVFFFFNKRKVVARWWCVTIVREWERKKPPGSWTEWYSGFQAF